MDSALIICETEQQAAEATGYLKGLGAKVDRKDNVADLSASTLSRAKLQV